MSLTSNLAKAAGLGVVVTALTVGTAFAAVATTSANVRTGPGLHFGVVDQLYPGEYVSISDRSGSWCEVNKRGPDGWVRCSALVNGRLNSFDRFHRGPSVDFNFGLSGPSVHLHSGPPPMYPWWY